MIKFKDLTERPMHETAKKQLQLENYSHTLKPSEHDSRDILADVVYYKTTNKFPKEFNWIDKIPPVRDQGKQGSCSAMTAAVMKELHERLELGFTGYLSPQFVYNLRPNKPEEGMIPRETMQILKNIGIIIEAQYPYGTSDNIDKILKQAAANFKIKKYARVRNINAAKAALMSDGILYAGFPVYHYGNKFWQQTNSRQQLQGGHAVAIVGWDKNGFIIRNSWGADWGRNGYSHYPYEDWGMHWEIWTALDDTSCQEKLDRILAKFKRQTSWIKRVFGGYGKKNLKLKFDIINIDDDE